MSKLHDNSQSRPDGDESYYERNSEERRAYQKAYYRRKKKQINSRRAASEKADPMKKEDRLAYNRAYYRKNRARILRERAQRYEEQKQSKAKAHRTKQPEASPANNNPITTKETSPESPAEKSIRTALDSLAKALVSLQEEIADERSSLARLERQENHINKFLNQINTAPATDCKILRRSGHKDQAA